MSGQLLFRKECSNLMSNLWAAILTSKEEDSCCLAPENLRCANPTAWSSTSDELILHRTPQASITVVGPQAQRTLCPSSRSVHCVTADRQNTLLTQHIHNSPPPLAHLLNLGLRSARQLPGKRIKFALPLRRRESWFYVRCSARALRDTAVSRAISRIASFCRGFICQMMFKSSM